MWWAQSSLKMNNTCILWNITKTKTLHWDLDIARYQFWRYKFCQASFPHPRPPATLHGLKQDFLCATRSIRDWYFFFFASSSKVPHLGFSISCLHFPQTSYITVRCRSCLAEGHLAKGKSERCNLAMSPQVCVCSEEDGVPFAKLHKVLYGYQRLCCLPQVYIPLYSLFPFLGF